MKMINQNQNQIIIFEYVNLYECERRLHKLLEGLLKNVNRVIAKLKMGRAGALACTDRRPKFHSSFD